MNIKSIASILMAALIAVPSVSFADKKREIKPKATAQDLRSELSRKEEGNKSICATYANKRQEVLTQINDLETIEKKLEGANQRSDILQNVRIWSAVATTGGVFVTALASKNAGQYGENAFAVLVLGAATAIAGISTVVSAGLESLSDGEVKDLKLEVLQTSNDARDAVSLLENLCK